MPPINIRNPSLEDMPKILELEKSWPKKERASEAALKSRVENFPEGAWIAEDLDNGGAIVGMTTSCLKHFNPEDLSAYSSWYETTNSGFINTRTDLRDENCNALYITSTIVRSDYRGKGIFSPLFSKHADVAKANGKRFLVTGCILRDFTAHQEKDPSLDPIKYALTKDEAGFYIDGLLAKVQKLGFTIPDERHVIPEYFACEDAHDWSALMVRDFRAALSS